MSATRVQRTIKAPRGQVFEALVDPSAIARWRVPAGMTSKVRVSLTYEDRDRAGKTVDRTDTYSGRFLKIVPDELVVEVSEFETEDASLRGEMVSTIKLTDVEGGTQLDALHDGLPKGLSAAENEAGWQESLARLASLVESDS